MTTTSAATSHKVFSLSRVYTIASNTLLELVRLKVFYFLLLFALLGIGVSLAVVKMTFQDQVQTMKNMGVGAMSIFSWLLAVLSTAMLLPKDIEERTLYTILAKPVPRFEYLLGKLLGVFALLFVAMTVMFAAFSAVLYFQEQTMLAFNVQQNAGSPEFESIQKAIKESSFTSNLYPGIAVIYLKAAVCAAVTLLISTFATSSIFTVMVSMTVFIIGYVQPMAREYILEENTAGSLTKAYLSVVALLIPDMRAFDLLNDIAAKIPLELFLQTAGLGAVYITVYFLVAYFIFAGKEL